MLGICPRRLGLVFPGHQTAPGTPDWMIAEFKSLSACAADVDEVRFSPDESNNLELTYADTSQPISKRCFFPPATGNGMLQMRPILHSLQPSPLVNIPRSIFFRTSSLKIA